MTTLSKMLPYTCYEVGHCWEPSCSKACLEICIICFIESCKIYGVVYLLTGLLQIRKMTFQRGRKLLKDHMRSSCFLCVNGFGFIGIFCIIRHLLGHINFFTASYLPSMLASLFAILVERPERRALLAIYVTNVASESLWNTAVEFGYAKSIPRGEILVFMGAMTVLGYYFRTPKPLSRMINSILQFFLGRGESGIMIQSRQSSPIESSACSSPTHSPWAHRLTSIFTKRHVACPHTRGCITEFIRTASRGFLQGFLLQLSIRILPSIPRLVKSPRRLFPLLMHKGNIQAGAFVSWFASVFKGTCCAGRWWHGKEKPQHGAVAGALSALAMYFLSAPSLALYTMWKTLEGLYENGCDAGYLPHIPGSVELLYCVSTAYLFHTCVMDNRNLKSSYRGFLKRLTWGRMYLYNRHLLDVYGFKSSVGFEHYWPDYDLSRISDVVKQLRPPYL